MTAWLTFAIVGVGTYLSRGVFILAVGDRVLPARLERGLRNIGPAVLAALTSSLLTSDGLGQFLGSTPEVAAVIAGVVVGLRRRTFAAGFLATITVWGVLSLLL